MKTLVFVNALQPCSFWFQFLEGKTPDQWVEGTLKTAFPDSQLIWLEWSSQPLPETFRHQRTIKTLDALSTVAFFNQIEQLSQGADLVVLARSDEPFLRQDLCAQLFKLHHTYSADYTFADGYPTGLAPELLSPKILRTLCSWAESHDIPFGRDVVFQTLSIDINAFDVETLLSPLDLRTARLSFTADTKRHFLLLERFWNDRLRDLKDFLEIVRDSGLKTRTLPASLLVQITDGSLQFPTYSPLQHFFPNALTNRNFLSIRHWNQILDKALSLAGDLRVFPSLWCEPSLHPQIETLLSQALERPEVSLVIETSGLGWNPKILEALAHQVEKIGKERLDWIIELDSQNPVSYKALRGTGFEEAQATTLRLLELFPHHVWPQTVRMQENEEEMEGFYRYWKEKAGRVILQKYNFYSGLLPQRKVADLSPWNRHPCWHVARDLCVLLDGRVPACRDDGSARQLLGNIFHDDLLTIWKKGADLYQKHLERKYPNLCQNCDEYYTYNF